MAPEALESLQRCSVLIASILIYEAIVVQTRSMLTLLQKIEHHNAAQYKTYAYSLFCDLLITF
jgi:hypothetical protein